MFHNNVKTYFPLSYFLYRSVTSNLGNLLTWRQLFRAMFRPFSIQIDKENMTLYISTVSSHPIICYFPLSHFPESSFIKDYPPKWIIIQSIINNSSAFFVSLIVVLSLTLLKCLNVCKLKKLFLEGRNKQLSNASNLTGHCATWSFLMLFLGPRGMRMGSGEGSIMRNFIVCTVHLI